MKKLLLFSLLLSFFTTQAFAFSYANFSDTDEPRETERSNSSHIRTAENSQKKLVVDVTMNNFTTADQEKINKGSEILETVINSEEFKQRVLNFTWKGEVQFNDNKGLSNQEIYDNLMTGAEVLMPDTLGVMNFDLSLYRSKNPWSKVKGYTLPDSMRIYMNKKFFRRATWTPLDVAGNMAHEWVHKMGYTHDYYNNPDRPYSVPYAIGYMVIDVAKEMGFGSFR